MTSNRSRLGLCLVSAGLFSVLLGGSGAFAQNTNTAYGEGALQNDTSNLGGNSAFGFNALFSSRESVNGNTATGYQALYATQATATPPPGS